MGGKPWLEKVIVELLQREGGALLLLQVFAQLHDFQLAQRVVEIGRVAGAALGFDQRGLLDW